MNPTQLSVIIPCFNEELGVKDVIEQIHAALLEIPNIDFEILTVNDGSTDETLSILHSLELKNLRVIHSARNQGYGASLKRGISEARYELLLITDADGTYPISSTANLIAEINSADMVVGARTGSNVNIPLIRRPAKWFINRLADYLSGFHIPDLNSGFRLMKKPIVERFTSILPEGFSFTTTITLAMLTSGYEVKYLPIDYAKRHGQSKIRPIHDTINFVQLIVRTVIYFRPLKFFVPLALFLFFAFLILFSIRIYQGGFSVISIVLLISSIQVLTTGMLADLIERRTKL